VRSFLFSGIPQEVNKSKPKKLWSPNTSNPKYLTIDEDASDFCAAVKCFFMLLFAGTPQKVNNS
jgi:hypothetical protein